METEHIIAVVGVLIAVITAIGVFLGPWCANRWQERKRIYSEAMTNHFQILNQDIIQPLIDDLGCLINDEGRILSRNASSLFSTYLFCGYHNPFDTMMSSGPYDSFRLHFPADSEAIRGCIDKLHGYNKTVEDFHEEIKTIVTESTELSLRDGGPPSFIYSTVPEDLRRALVQLGRNEKLGDDFRSLKIVDEGERLY